jgi:hypothetical protein
MGSQITLMARRLFNQKSNIFAPSDVRINWVKAVRNGNSVARVLLLSPRLCTAKAIEASLSVDEKYVSPLSFLLHEKRYMDK